eukprot:1100897-Amphidinium_carterae.1
MSWQRRSRQCLARRQRLPETDIRSDSLTESTALGVRILWTRGQRERGKAERTLKALQSTSAEQSEARRALAVMLEQGVAVAVSARKTLPLMHEPLAGISYNEGQSRVIAVANGVFPLVAVQAPPGTGKTLLALGLAADRVRQGYRVAYVAPANATAYEFYCAADTRGLKPVLITGNEELAAIADTR